MPDGAIEVLPYALLAALSPLAFAATLAVLQTSRLRALAFGIGFVAAQLVTCGLLVAVGVAVTGATRRSHTDRVAVLEIVLAAALVAAALRLRRSPPKEQTDSSHRTRAILDRLGRVRVSTGFVAGVLLGIGGPKRLVITGLAATVIAAASTDSAGQVALVVFYGAVATVLVWVPIAAFALVGERAVAVMRAAQQTLAARQRVISFYGLLLVAAFLTLEAATLLLG